MKKFKIGDWVMIKNYPNSENPTPNNYIGKVGQLIDIVAMSQEVIYAVQFQDKSKEYFLCVELKLIAQEGKTNKINRTKCSCGVNSSRVGGKHDWYCDLSKEEK